MPASFKSMHPRVYMSGGTKRNTSKPRSKQKYIKQIAGLERHLETNPGDSEARKRLATAKQRLNAL